MSRSRAHYGHVLCASDNTGRFQLRLLIFPLLLDYGGHEGSISEGLRARGLPPRFLSCLPPQPNTDKEEPPSPRVFD